MAYRVMSSRWLFPQGSLISESMVPEGCNIALLLDTGHLVRVSEPTKKTTKPKPPADPELEPAELPEEQD